MSDDTNTPRRRGRPGGRDPATVRSALLGAARELFTRRDFKAVTVRQIAAQAGVNPAMVHYYFEDKRGLYTTMVQESVGPLLTDLAAAEDGGAGLTLREFLRRYIATLAANPWLPNLLVREVLYADNGFRDEFVARFAGRVGGELLPRLIRREQTAGRIRPDLDPRDATLSLLSMAVFPFIARPLAEQALGLTMDAAFVDRYVEHTERLFYAGAGGRDQ